MSSVRPAPLNALSRDGRSLFSQRFEVTVSGRITPTFWPPPVGALVADGTTAPVVGAVPVVAGAVPVVGAGAGAPVVLAGAGAPVVFAGADEVLAALLPLLLPQPVSATAAMAPTAANFMARLDM